MCGSDIVESVFDETKNDRTFKKLPKEIYLVEVYKFIVKQLDFILRQLYEDKKNCPNIIKDLKDLKDIVQKNKGNLAFKFDDAEVTQKIEIIDKRLNDINQHMLTLDDKINFITDARTTLTIEYKIEELSV